MKTRKGEKQDIVHTQEIAKCSWEDTYKDLIPAEIRQTYMEQAHSYAAFFVEEAGAVSGFAQLTRSIWPPFMSPLKSLTVEQGHCFLKQSYTN